MLINENNYLWSRAPVMTFSVAAGEQLIDGGIPVRFYRIEGEATISLYEDETKENLIYEGAVPVEFETPISCDAIYLVCDRETTLSVIGETGVGKADFTPYLNTSTGMTTLSSGTDDGTVSAKCPFNFMFNGAVASTIYVSGNHWIGFGSSTEHLKIMRRDGYASTIHYQSGSLRDDLQFFKIRFSGYTVYNSKTTANRLIFELFLLSNNDMFLNLIQTPTSSNTGTSSLTCNGSTISLNLVDSTGKGGGKFVTFVSESSNGTEYSVEYRKYTEDSIATECYLLQLEDGYYTIIEDTLTLVEMDTLTPGTLLKYGFEELPTSEIMATLSNPHLYYWRTDGKRYRLTANITAEPFPQIMTATADMSHETIVGIDEMTAQFAGMVNVQYSVDLGETYSEEMLLSDFLNIDVVALWESAQANRRIDFRFTLYAGASLTSFRIHYTN